MKMFKLWLLHWLSSAHDNEGAITDLSRPRARLRAIKSNSTNWSEDEYGSRVELRANSMNFRLYNCVGGHVLETSVFNSRTDENEHTLYMIKEEDDFARQVAQAIMIEMMKQ